MVIAATIYALGMLITSAVWTLRMLAMSSEGSESNLAIRDLFRVYPYAIQLAVMFVGIVMLWPVLWAKVVIETWRGKKSS